jgi:hypothetical protein
MARLPKRKVVALHEANALDRQETARSEEADLNFEPPHPFPVVNTLPRLPTVIPDEILEYYGWFFCQGGFVNLRMTFEQFLAVVAAINPLGFGGRYSRRGSDPSDD